MRILLALSAGVTKMTEQPRHLEDLPVYSPIVCRAFDNLSQIHTRSLLTLSEFLVSDNRNRLV